MALTHGHVHYTKLVQFETGDVRVRRVHKMVTHNSDGTVKVQKGDSLPDAIVLNTGRESNGEHSAQIIERPHKTAAYYTPRDSVPWPSLRDVANFGMGFMAIAILRVIIALFEAL